MCPQRERMHHLDHSTKTWVLPSYHDPLVLKCGIFVILSSLFHFSRGLKLNFPWGLWRQSLGGAGPHQVLHKKSTDKNIPMFLNIFVFILRRGPKIVVPRAASLRPLHFNMFVWFPGYRKSPQNFN